MEPKDETMTFGELQRIVRGLDYKADTATAGHSEILGKLNDIQDKVGVIGIMCVFFFFMGIGILGFLSYITWKLNWGM